MKKKDTLNNIKVGRGINTALLDMNKEKSTLMRKRARVIHRREIQMKNSSKEEDMKAPK